MKISLSMPPDMLNLATGHGVVGFNMVTTLQSMGHTLPYRDKTADVEINYCHPQMWEWSGTKSYRIGYLAWESTEPRKSWRRIIENDCDEIWTPSPLISSWVQGWVPDKTVRTYLHGVDQKVWTRKKRVLENTFKFLHPDSSANRKNSEMTYEAFRAAFSPKDDVQITFKHVGESLIRNVKDERVKFVPGPKNVNEVAFLYKRNHCLILPSSNEGFGLPPLEAIFTGMPVIIPQVWAPYKNVCIEDLDLPATLVRSPWPEEHPGQVFEPNFDELVAKMREVVENYQRYSALAYSRSKAAHEKYNWKKVTQDAWQVIFDKFESNSQ